jgi:predicted nuclease of predicted toxin-antitoxin system
MTIDEIIADYPDLERDDLLGCPRVWRLGVRPTSSGTARRCVKFLIDTQ